MNLVYSPRISPMDKDNLAIGLVYSNEQGSYDPQTGSLSASSIKLLCISAKDLDAYASLVSQDRVRGVDLYYIDVKERKFRNGILVHKLGLRCWDISSS